MSKYGLLDRMRRLLPSAPVEALSAVSAYNRWAPTYDEVKNPVQEFAQTMLEQMLIELEHRRLLDFGCGRGRAGHIALSRGATVVGIDPSLEMVDLARRSCGHPEARWLHGGVELLEAQRDAFDVITCSLVLGHIEHIGPVFDAFGGCTGAGARLILIDFHPFATLRGWERSFCDENTGSTVNIVQHVHLFSEIVAAARRNHFNLVFMRESLHNDYPVVYGMVFESE